MRKHPLYNQTGLQKDNKSHVIYALANKQMELKQLEDEYTTKIAKIKSDLTAMEQVICLFDGDCTKTLAKMNKKTTNGSRKPRNSYFAKGECKKLILKILREENKSLSTKYLSDKVIEVQGLDINDERIIQNIPKTLNTVLRKLKVDNLVDIDIEYPDTSKRLYWKIKD